MMRKYKKIIDDKEVIKSANQIVIRNNGMQTFNPTEAQILADGWEVYERPIYTPTLEDIKARKVDEVLAYDSSSAVNEFTIGGQPMWIDKATRAGLLLRLQAEKSAGLTETSLWYEGTQFTLPTDSAMQMLMAVELYASECYDNTQRHLAEVANLESIELVEAYDYTIGYPVKLEFNA